MMLLSRATKEQQRRHLESAIAGQLGACLASEASIIQMGALSQTDDNLAERKAEKTGTN